MEASDKNVQSLCNVVTDLPHSVLATAWIRVKTGWGQLAYLRVLCDTGAQVSLLSDQAFRQLRLMRQPTGCNVVGVNGSGVTTMGKIVLNIWHRSKDEVLTKGTFTIVDGITVQHPRQSFVRPILSHLTEEDLADPKYNEANEIAGIMGVDILATQLRAGLQRGPHGLITQETSFGWIVFGGIPQPDSIDSLATIGIVSLSDMYSLVRRLWELDELHENEQVVLTPDEIACEELYKSTLVKGEHRYCVSLLLRPDAQLGRSHAMALRRLYCLERRFRQNPELRDKYIRFMREYEECGHMRRASPLPMSETNYYYIPHHAVSIDRKFRVVFDASARTTNGKSLNDVQYVGARQQRDLFDIHMTFRTGKIAMTADIAKMFRQVEVRQEEWNFQRILWRESPNDEVTDFWLTVVTYGLASSPFNAVRTLNQCALDHEAEFPQAAQTVRDDFYVDDLLTSAESVEEAITMKKNLIALLRKGGFELTKWRATCNSLMTEDNESKLVQEQNSTSVLGIIWNYRSDEFQFKVQSRVQPDNITKRVVSSEAARIFDPQGYMAPITIRAKMFIQELWRTKKGWDDPILPELQNDWRTFCNEIRAIEQISIPRWLGTSKSTKSQVHIFCDASCKAYGAAAYIRTLTDAKWSAQLLCSKSKVAPIKLLTIPRMELCAVELACKLIRRIRRMSMFHDAPVYIWTDSEIVLFWLRKPCNLLKTFVANRVTKILDTVRVDQSRYIPTDQNPADLLSRGVRAESLIDRSLWWNGPTLLSQSNEDWPLWEPRVSDAATVEATNTEVKRSNNRDNVVLLTTATDTQPEIELISRWSSYKKTCRVTAFILRFCYVTYRTLHVKRPLVSPHNWRVYATDQWKSEVTREITYKGNAYNVRLPSLIECNGALLYWIRRSQKETFPLDYDVISKGLVVSKKSPLWMLTPQMNDDGVMRIYGRLNNSDLPEEVKHPIILHRTSPLARAIAIEAHETLEHGGVQACTQYLRHRYWIIGIRILLRGIVFKCVKCTRYRQQTANQFMADLPVSRLHPAPAFERTGVDYAGPITLKYQRNNPQKAWIAVFVCMRYKAVHLELVGTLETKSFIAALTRFVNLRAGCVKHMYSDNGTNFVGAARELREAADAWNDHRVAEYLTAQHIEWHFNTPFAPHHGGLWEAMVKSVKTHLRKMSGAHLFTFEEMATLLAKISACINSRPLTPISTDPSDLTALTPSHFISSRPIVSPLEEPLADVPLNRLNAWQKVTKLQQEFWNRWSQEYLTEQQRRNKWAGIYRSLKVGDLVLIKNELTPPSLWLMGRVIEVFVGPDGLVRSCRIQTMKSTYERPVTKLCLLQIGDDPPDTSETGFSAQ